MPPALAALTSMAALARLLPERDPHPNLYEVTLFVLGFLDEPQVWPALRGALGAGAAGGAGLRARSRRPARRPGQTAISSTSRPNPGAPSPAEAGEPYKDRLLALPAFLRGRATDR